MTQVMTGKVAIVTGGSKGYGYGIAQALAKRGASVWITGRNADALKKAAKAMNVHAIRADATKPRDWDRVFKQVLADAGRLDILVNNAGAGVKIAPLAEQSDEEIESSLMLNLGSMLMGCRRAAPVMTKQRSGVIVNISSGCARHAWPGWSTYSAAKAGMVQAAKCLYAELRPRGVRVTTVIPYWGATDFVAASNITGHPAGDPKIAAQSMQPDQMGKLVADICELPPHLEMLDVTVMPLVQEIVPL